MMPTAPPECSTPDGVRSLEVRWIFRGQLSTAVAAWFERFPAETESRDDAYLLAPHLHGLSVKLRGGRALDVKVYRGSPGILDVTGRVRGCLESWQKWSFPYATVSQNSGNPSRMDSGKQNAADQPVPAGQWTNLGARPGAR